MRRPAQGDRPSLPPENTTRTSTRGPAQTAPTPHMRAFEVKHPDRRSGGARSLHTAACRHGRRGQGLASGDLCSCSLHHLISGRTGMVRTHIPHACGKEATRILPVRNHRCPHVAPSQDLFPKRKAAAGLRSATAFRYAHMTTRGSPEIVTDCRQNTDSALKDLPFGGLLFVVCWMPLCRRAVAAPVRFSARGLPKRPLPRQPIHGRSTEPNTGL